MKLNLLIALDFAPERFAGWHMLNTLLQKRAGIHMHLLTPANHQEQTQMIDEGDVDIIYANPFDAAHLIREKGYRAVARPKNKANEMVIATKAEGAFKQLDELKKGCKVAMADNRDVKLIGLRLLEAVDLAENDIEWNITENYQAAAREVIKGNADVGFFLSEVYHSLSRLTLSQLHILIESDLSDITHVVLVNEKMTGNQEALQALMGLTADTEGQEVLAELGITAGFEPMTEEDGEFMIDLMDTLLD
ncbi:phosphate/phosphonate ABC transporter periplasmic protein [Moraxella macacae 0408225]|uniref:Phosphate/phosphonate ABC transporter periplasmic protein n=1 Tax=Moraxella macacae 0408225 TaxID=1230338 RepID=L2F5R7_9GAMM|nr:phosphate/phosphite/phosphonate ABC transporter substrate-binding protein [Moraxella macacae]ELA08101.1 phosphate/phosphonate ABC transporter periplasmic protein [Moraxella macacae 0408225]